MQCAACRAVYSNALDACPRCKSSASSSAAAVETESTTATATPPPPHQEARRAAPPEALSSVASPVAPSNDTAAVSVSTQTAPVSTLIEFPGSGRAARPQWRKELSERVREIQQRRAREAALEAEHATRLQAENPGATDVPPAGLGLVPPPPEAPQPNAHVIAAALARVERARRQQHQPAPRATVRGGAATAVARVAEESYQTALEVSPDVATKPAPHVSAPPVAEVKTEQALESRALVRFDRRPAPGNREGDDIDAGRQSLDRGRECKDHFDAAQDRDRDGDCDDRFSRHHVCQRRD